MPPGHSPGDTHSSRSGFHEMNRIKEQARSHLPGNSWLREQLQANMNINLTCNAFWNGATVNFYRFGDGCANTGEIAAVFDHEWGHGMDDNDALPSVSNPGEGIADIYAAQRLYTSCIGRGFRLGVAGQNGWAGSSTSWSESTWSSSALGAAAVAGEPVRLDVRYGTDALAQGFGFHFDQVTLTDFSEQVPDALPDSCPSCGNAVCEPGEDPCNCPADCGTPPASEVPNSTCFDTVDNDCDGDTDCDDSDCFGIDPNCPAVVCGDGVCDSSAENCVTCPADCNGARTGKPQGRYCCGDGGGENPVPCSDPRCTQGGVTCI